MKNKLISILILTIILTQTILVITCNAQAPDVEFEIKNMNVVEGKIVNQILLLPIWN